MSRRWLVTPVTTSAASGLEPLEVDPSATPGEAAAGLVDVEAPDGDGRRRAEVVVDGWRFVVDVESAERAALRARATRARGHGAGSGAPLDIRAIIPGRVAAVAVAVGDSVTAGQPLLVVEAMKMQNELRAPRSGTVHRVMAADGATVEIGDLLVVLG